jgi:hypothetical protein
MSKLKIGKLETEEYSEAVFASKHSSTTSSYRNVRIGVDPKDSDWIIVLNGHGANGLGYHKDHWEVTLTQEPCSKNAASQ